MVILYTDVTFVFSKPFNRLQLSKAHVFQLTEIYTKTTAKQEICTTQRPHACVCEQSWPPHMRCPQPAESSRMCSMNDLTGPSVV